MNGVTMQLQHGQNSDCGYPGRGRANTLRSAAQCSLEPGSRPYAAKQSAAAKQSMPAQQEESSQVRLELSEEMQQLEKQFAMQQREQTKKKKDALVDLAKIMEIARRIARGDRVPQKDEKKLMEYSGELYQMAKSAAMLHMRAKHKKHKSLFEEEEENQKLQELSASAEGGESGAVQEEAAEPGETVCM